MTDDLAFAIMIAIAAISTLVQLYGIYTAFCKKWWLAVLALFFPQFAFIIGITKLLKRDILA